LANSISKKEYSNIGLRFDELLEKGIELTQKYSGDIWTDYNYHDPGVTILEYLVYALMDLSYRTNLPIEDLFFLNVDKFDSVQNNLLFAPHEAFPIDPYTELDYRKMIIDRIKMVKNAWVNPIQNDPYGYKGLFEILIQSREELDDQKRAALQNEVASLFHQNRNIGNDLVRLKLLNEIPLTIIGKINIDVDAVGEYVMAKIYSEIDDYINPEITSQDPFELIQDGKDTDEVFSGPKPIHGFIPTENLRPKSDTLFVSRIKDIINKVEGVKNVVSLKVLKKGIPVHEDQIIFDNESYPIIEYAGVDSDTADGIQIFKNNIELDIDPITTQQLIDFDLAAKRNNYLGKINYKDNLPRGRFLPQEIEKHYAIHDDFPIAYGIGRNSQIPRNDSNERKAKSVQLRGYLSFFEQFIANHLAQLTHLRELFSKNNLEGETYYTQYPDGIPLFEEIIFGDPDSFKEYLKTISNQDTNYYTRMNRALDHLLARFSEYIDGDALKKYAMQGNAQSRQHIEKGIIDTKVRFLKNIIQLSTSRNTAFDYKSTKIWDTDNFSKLELKIGLTLNILHLQKRSLVRPLLEWVGIKKNSDSQENWYEDSIQSEGNVQIIVKRLSPNAYSDNELHFPKQHISFISHLFSNATNPKFLRVIKNNNSGNQLYSVLFKGVDSSNELVIYEHSNLENCENLVEKFKNRIFELNTNCEGFHMIEHILLRPLEPIFFTFNILDESGQIFLTGYFPGSLSEQNIISDEIPLLGSRSENFSVVSEDNNITFKVLLYDSNMQPVAKLKKEFNSRPGAEKALENAVIYLTRINNRELMLNQVLEITTTDLNMKEVPAEFNYSNEISFILPSWPTRFQNQDFITLFKSIVSENIPAHFNANIYLLDPEKLSKFEEIFGKWLHLKSQEGGDLKSIDILSVQLTQILEQLKNNAGM